MTFECLIQTALSSALFHRRCTALEEWIVVRILKSRCFFKNGFNLRAADSRAVIMLRDEVSTPPEFGWEVCIEIWSVADPHDQSFQPLPTLNLYPVGC